MITIHRPQPRGGKHGSLMMAQNAADIDADLIGEDEGSYLIDDGVVQVWVSKFLAEDNGDGSFTMPEWLAIREGLV